MSFPKSMQIKGGVRVSNTAALKLTEAPSAARATLAMKRLRQMARKVRAKVPAIGGG